MDVEYILRGINFRWDAAKAHSNLVKHGLTFEQAAQVFFDPLMIGMDVSRNGEEREAALGCDFQYRLLFVVHILFEDDHIRIISAREAEPAERRRYETGND